MKAVPWKKLGSTEVFQHPRLTLVEDTVELPDGKTTSYIRQAPAQTFSVCIIAINDKQEVLLQKEYSYPPNAVLWQLPGGEGKIGEDIIAAANRELSEESGFIGTRCSLLGAYYLDNRRSDKKQHVVLCTNLVAKTAQRDDEEFIETHWVPVDQLRSQIRSGAFNSAPLLAALNLYFAVSS